MTTEAFDRVHLDGTGFDRITEEEVVSVVREAINAGRGGRILTPNVDILRQAQARSDLRAHLDDADLVVADGMPATSIYVARDHRLDRRNTARLADRPEVTVHLQPGADHLVVKQMRADGTLEALVAGSLAPR